MSQVYAICTIDGAIRLTEIPPADGQFGLAVGDSLVLSGVIWETATFEMPAVPDGRAQLRVPGAEDAAEGRSNLQAIAAYIQRLKELESAATLIEFEDHGQDFLRWSVDRNGLVTGSWPFQKRVWVGLKVTNLIDLKPGCKVEYFNQGRRGAIVHPVKSVSQGITTVFRAMGV